jgi:membrane protein implicated in regulation of membrane protease activity
MQRMILRSPVVRVAACIIAAAAMIVPQLSYAQEGGLSITITPPLVQLSIGPGETWSSSLKVVNNNTYDVTYYTQVVDMQPDGEDGQSKFVPMIDEAQDPTYQSYALAQWIQMSPGPTLIKAGESANLPYTVSIPADAEPGGHYAAILVGTQPGTIAQAGSVAEVSSYVSSLIFVNIKGDVVESGRIREFSTSKSLYQTPDVDFTVRFENTGNTHVHPQGEVTIYNMWGKERGQVLINNEDANFGDVLPASIRRFQFSWSGDQDIFDIGPYSAIVTLNYGDDGKQSVTATTYFWIVPIVPVSIALGSIILFLLLLTWLIRRYVRRALTLEKSRLGIPASMPLKDVKEMRVPVIETLIEPLREGVIDLRSVRGKNVAAPAAAAPTGGTAAKHENSLTFYEFIVKYRLFVLFLAVCVIAVIVGWWYFTKVLDPNRSYQISNIIIGNDASSTQ